MIPNYDPQNVEMIDSVVCFVDILGFQSLVNQAVTSGSGNDFLKRIHNSLKGAREELVPYSNDLASVKVFTDNIVVGWPIWDDSESELGRAFMGFARYQLELALSGFFVRGGISIGEHYMDEETVFGPALIESYNLESKVAVYPRVILSELAKRRVQEHMRYYGIPANSPQHLHILKDSDGQWFVNYLYVLLQSGENHLRSRLVQHKQIVEEKLEEYKDDSKLLDKYGWVANYHNYFCENYVENSEGYIITLPHKCPSTIL